MKRIVCLAMVALTAAGAQANMIDFEGSICSAASSGIGASVACTDSSFVNQTHGDATGVDVSYGNSLNADSLNFWSTDYIGLNNVAWTGAYGTNAAGLITLAATAGYAITLNTFQLSFYPLGPVLAAPATTYTVTDLATSVSTTMSFVTLSSLYTANIGLTSTAGFKISFGPDAEYVGIDNISFNVSPVPEPMGFVLAAAAAAVLVGSKRYVKRSARASA
jgi:hypothetical protein